MKTQTVYQRERLDFLSVSRRIQIRRKMELINDRLADKRSCIRYQDWLL